MKTRKFLAAKAAIVGFTVVMTMTACQTTQNLPVIKRPNSLYETTGMGKTKLIAQQAALTTAKAQCGKLSTPVVVTDTVTYHGVLDEGMGRVADKAVGALGSVFGKKASLASDDDYEYTVSFRCE